MRSDDTNLTRLTRDKLLREKWLFERMTIVVLFGWIITANLALLLLRTLQANGWGGVFLGVAAVVALGGQGWVLYRLRAEVKRRISLIAGVNEMLVPQRAKAVEPVSREGAAPEALSSQVRQVFESMGPDVTKH